MPVRWAGRTGASAGLDVHARARISDCAGLRDSLADGSGPSLGSPVRAQNKLSQPAIDGRTTRISSLLRPLETHELLTPAQKRCGVTITPRRGCGRTRGSAAKKARSAGRSERRSCCPHAARGFPVRLTVSERDGRRIASNVSLVAEEPRGRGATPELQRPLAWALSVRS
jgi:hypothetical protein